MDAGQGTAESRARRIVVIGGGKMGEAIVSGWVSATEGAAAPIGAEDIVVVEPDAQRRSYLAGAHGVACVENAAALDAAFAPDLVLLSVKPQVMASAVEGLGDMPAFRGANPLCVSIAAGITTAALAALLPAGARLVRVMPNMPLMVGAGASGVCASRTADAQDVAFVADLFGCLGSAVVVDEADMDVVCALSGSGPAYVAAMVEALRDAAVVRGLASDIAETLALQTVLGTARLIAETDLDSAAAREAVCSPGGTTLAALDAMNRAGFSQVFDAGVQAAVQRSKELAQC